MRIVIIGNGIAGNSVAEKIRELDKNISVTIVSEENFNEYSACVLANFLAGEIDRKSVFIKSSRDYRKNNINTILGKKVIKICSKDKEIYFDNYQKLSYDKLVLSIGSHSFIPNIWGVNMKGVFLFKSISDIDKIIFFNPKKVAVIGSGPIGIEASAALKKRGCEVYLIEALNWIMPKLFDENPAIILKKALEKNGIHIKTGERLIEIFGSNEVEGIKTDRDLIKCDAVILAIGTKPNVGLAVQSGIKIGKLGGIKVDNFLQTSEEGIYACGDCIETNNNIDNGKCLNMLWSNAKSQGDVVGFNLLGNERRYYGSENIMVLHIFENYAVSIGKTYLFVCRNKGVETKELIKKDRYMRIVSKKNRLIGVQVINEFHFVGLLLGLIRNQTNIANILLKVNNHDEIISKHTLIPKIISYIK